MADTDKALDSNRFRITAITAAPAIFGMAALIVANFYGGLTYTQDPWIALGFSGFLVVLGLSHFIPALKFGVAHAFYLYLYHLVLCFAVIFVVPTMSFYLYMWILFLYASQYYFHKIGSLLSSSALLAVMILGSMYQQSGLDSSILISIGVQFIIIMGVNQVMTSMAIGNRIKSAETKDKVDRAQSEQDRMIALINSMSDAVIATDENGIVINYNAAALDILDTNDTLTGKKITDYLKVFSANHKAENILDIAKKTDYILRRGDLTIEYGDHEDIALDVSISKITKSTVLDRKEGYTFLLRDITLQKSLDDEKDLFIHEVSHELRSPITVAEGELSMAIMLAEKPQPDLGEIRKTVTRGHQQVVFLGEMINDLSALSRAAHDSKATKVEEFAIAEILNELEENYRPMAESKELYLKIDLAPSIPNVTTSRLYFKEILDNFITNAIKYTEKGGITVKGQAIDKDHIMISVIDTGIGISKEEQVNVYQKFWRSEDPLTRAANGTGLGLYVTKQLVDNIGAELTLRSKPKEGSTFSIIISTKGKEDPISKSPLKKFFRIN